MMVILKIPIAYLGFVVYWPSWVMCSEPLPGLDRYMPTRPPHLL